MAFDSPRALKYAKYPHKCLVCETDFLSMKKMRRFCSKKCAQESRNKRFKNPPKHPLLVSKGGKMRTGFIHRCLFCDIEFYVSPSREGMYRMTFCSKEHMWAFQKKNSAFINCVICGKVKYSQPYAIKYKKRSTCSRKCFVVLTRKRTAERHKKLPPNVANRLARHAPELVIWRNAVFARDDFTCQMCGERGGYLEADHIKPFAFFPELRHELDNGRTLCRPCHDRTKIGYKKMRELYATQT